MSNCFKRRFSGRPGPCDRCGKIRRLCAITDTNTRQQRQFCRQCCYHIDQTLARKGIAVSYVEYRPQSHSR